MEIVRQNSSSTRNVSDTTAHKILEKHNQGAQQVSCVKGTSLLELMTNTIYTEIKHSTPMQPDRKHISEAAASDPQCCQKSCGQQVTLVASVQKPCQSVELLKSYLTVETIVCTVSHLAKSRQTGKQMLISSFCLSCSCPKKGAEQGAVPSGQAPPKKTKEQKTQNQTCYSYRPIYPTSCDLQAFFSLLFSVHLADLPVQQGYHKLQQHPHCQRPDV